MEELQFFNVFNYCFVSPTYLHFDHPTGRYIFRTRNVCWNVTLLTVSVASSLVSAIIIILDLQDLLGNVMGATTIIHHVMRQLIMVPLILWALFYSRTLVNDCTFALKIVQEKFTLLNRTSDRRNVFKLLWLQISIIAVVLFLGLAVQSATVWQIKRLRQFHYIYNLWAFAFLGFITQMHLMLAQCWTLFISHHIEDLVSLLKVDHTPVTLTKVISLWDDLQCFKQRIASTFGIMNVLHTLDAMLTCAVDTYTTFYVYELGLGLKGAFLNLVTMLLYTGTFYAFTYAHELLQCKEAELKNALKSMQYTNITKQTRDQKDFYDLVNLKLMMETPKITACGLFEINLQIFYNVR
ncbi:uncharacterized protein LOC128302976 [Anopheles moucheti]|uniref:uncharacterized protein LOC128302976 n=1 Tax=Anopheles moucheti TaxID=186751 RepID=UPI0022F06130|nr:uncharacterized protein LOC128302976 [Anopheles moucheti]